MIPLFFEGWEFKGFSTILVVKESPKALWHWDGVYLYKFPMISAVIIEFLPSRTKNQSDTRITNLGELYVNFREGKHPEMTPGRFGVFLFG